MPSVSRTMTSGGSEVAMLFLLDERDLVDLAQRRLSFRHFEECRLAEEGHALFLGGAFDFCSGAPVENHPSNTVGEVEKFRDGGATVKAGAVALEAARAFVEGRR